MRTRLLLRLRKAPQELTRFDSHPEMTVVSLSATVISHPGIPQSVGDLREVFESAPDPRQPYSRLWAVHVLPNQQVQTLDWPPPDGRTDEPPGLVFVSHVHIL